MCMCVYIHILYGVRVLLKLVTRVSFEISEVRVYALIEMRLPRRYAQNVNSRLRRRRF